MRCSPILRPKRERTTAKKTARDAPTRNEMGELVVDWGDPIQRQRSGGMLQNSIRPRGLTVQGGQTIAIPPRLPSGSTRSSGSFVWREASGPNSVLSALDRKARISASSPRCALWPLSRHHSARKAARFPATSRWRPGSPRSFAGTRWRWVVRANATCGELGGQVASYASVAEIFDGPLILSPSWLMPDFWPTPTGRWALARSVRSISRFIR